MEEPQRPEDLRRLIGTTSLFALWCSRTTGLFGLFMVLVWTYAWMQRRHVNIDGGAFWFFVAFCVVVGLFRAASEQRRRRTLYDMVDQGGPFGPFA